MELALVSSCVFIVIALRVRVRHLKNGIDLVVNDTQTEWTTVKKCFIELLYSVIYSISPLFSGSPLGPSLCSRIDSSLSHTDSFASLWLGFDSDSACLFVIVRLEINIVSFNFFSLFPFILLLNTVSFLIFFYFYFAFENKQTNKQKQVNFRRRCTATPVSSTVPPSLPSHLHSPS